MADGTEEEKRTSLKGQKAISEKTDKKACICHANLHRHRHTSLKRHAHTEANKYNHLSSGLKWTVLQLCTATQVVGNGFWLRMKHFKSKRRLLLYRVKMPEDSNTDFLLKGWIIAHCIDQYCSIWPKPRSHEVMGVLFLKHFDDISAIHVWLCYTRKITAGRFHTTSLQPHYRVPMLHVQLVAYISMLTCWLCIMIQIKEKFKKYIFSHRFSHLEIWINSMRSNIFFKIKAVVASWCLPMYVFFLDPDTQICINKKWKEK